MLFIVPSLSVLKLSVPLFVITVPNQVSLLLRLRVELSLISIVEALAKFRLISSAIEPLAIVITVGVAELFILMVPFPVVVEDKVIVSVRLTVPELEKVPLNVVFPDEVMRFELVKAPSNVVVPYVVIVPELLIDVL